MQPLDRLPFWPKLGPGYAMAQAAPWSGMKDDHIHQTIGSDPHFRVSPCFREVHEVGSFEEHLGGDKSRALYTMPRGQLRAVWQHDQSSHSWHPIEFPVKQAENIELMAEWWRDVAVSVDENQVAKAWARVQELGQDAIVAANIGTSGLMEWVEHLAGVENAHYFMLDYPEKVRDLLESIQAVLLRRAEVALQHCPADFFYLTENTSTSLVSPAQYREWCFPHIRQVAERAQEAGKLLVLHMCGLIRDLLPDLEKIPVAAFEAFTSPTVGNTTLLDGRTQCPTKCLIGGTNAMLWLQPDEEIVAQIYRDLDALPHHRGIVVSSAGVMPPGCAPETIRAVCEAVKTYPARF